MATAASALTQITRVESVAREAVKTLTKQKEALDEQRGEAEEAQRIATAERETRCRNRTRIRMRISAVSNARQLAEQASKAETTADRSRQRAGEAQAEVLPRTATAEGSK